MSVDAKRIEDAIRRIYPELDEHDLEMSVKFDDSKDCWVVHVSNGKESLATHLEKKDAEDCLEGTRCIYLGNQIGGFIEAYCLGSKGACDV